MKKGTLFGTLLALVVVVASPFITQARSANDSSDDAPQFVTTSLEKQDHASKLSEDVQAKRAEIEREISQKRTEIREKLSGKRAVSCEKKQASINQILDNRINTASRHLEHFKDIQNKLTSFVEAKNLSVDNKTALEVIMNDAQAAAQAAIDSAAATNFTCGEADAGAPGRIVTEQVSAQKETLKNYRSALKDYAVAIKSALATTAVETEGASQ